MSTVNLTGLASGFDWQSFVDQMVEVERTPETRLRTEQSTLQQKNNAYSSIVTEMKVLKSRIDALKDASLFDSHTTTSGDSSIATATAASSAALGSYKITIDQLATAASQQGVGDIGKALSASNDVSGLVLSSACFGSPITEGTFTVNGKQITIATTDTLQAVFDKISTATNGAVTGSYDSATDKINLTSTGQIVLGSSTDTSNFLQAAKLYNNGSGSISSAFALGVAQINKPLSSSNLGTAITADADGNGSFQINGVTFNYNINSDSLSNVLTRINSSNAGVTASYDVVNDRFVLTNKSTGDMGIALQDGTGSNFLAATGLSDGTFNRGKNCLYSINDGAQLTSFSNTITEASSNVTGLTITALKESSTTTIQVASDTDKIKSAITAFVDQYNKVQSLIDGQTASSTDSSGKVTSALLSDDSDASQLASGLRGLVNATISTLNVTVKRLDSLGIVSNGNDNNLSVADTEKLSTALASNLNDVKNLFTNGTDGLATKLCAYLEDTVGEDGSIVTHQASLTKQSSAIDTQIADMERLIAAKKEQMTQAFVAMETAQANINQQLQYLTKNFK